MCHISRRPPRPHAMLYELPSPHGAVWLSLCHAMPWDGHPHTASNGHPSVPRLQAPWDPQAAPPFPLGGAATRQEPVGYSVNPLGVFTHAWGWGEDL